MDTSAKQKHRPRRQPRPKPTENEKRRYTTMTKKEMKAAVDKLKMLQNGKAALEGMTEEDSLELFGISRAQALSNAKAGIAKIEQMLFRAEHPLTGIDKTIFEIAAKYKLTIAGINQHIGSLFMDPTPYLIILSYNFEFVTERLIYLDQMKGWVLRSQNTYI